MPTLTHLDGNLIYAGFFIVIAAIVVVFNMMKTVTSRILYVGFTIALCGIGSWYWPWIPTYACFRLAHSLVQ